MSEAASSWIAPVSVLLFGVVVGVILLMRYRGVPAVGAAEDRGDLSLGFDTLIARLREVEGDPHLDDGEKRSEIARLEREAAIALREMETAPAVSAPAPPAASRPMRTMLWVTGSVVAATVMYLVLLQSLRPREESVPMTGGSEEAAGAPVDPRLASLQQSVRANPDDLTARLELARVALEQRDLIQVFEQTEYVLQKSPGNPRALTYQSLVRLSMGQPQQALEMLQAALQRQPDLLEAWLHLSIVHLEMGNSKAAFDALDVAKRHHPESSAAIDLLRGEIQARLDGSAAPTPAPPEPAAQPADYAGTIDVSPAQRQQIPADAVIFVVVRAAGVSSGPPLAAKRLPANSFPLSFTLSSSDSMRGEALPRSARIEVRIDIDGNAMTRETAPSAVLDNVAAGQQKLSIVLQ